MDLFQIIDDIAQADPEVYARFDSRRATFRHFLGFGRKFSAAALPVALSTLFTRAYGQAATLPQAVIDILNLALQLEYLEFHFYDTALNSPALMLSSDENKSLTIIRNDENLHINALRAALGNSAVPGLSRLDFDYTGSQRQTQAVLFAGLGSSGTGLFTDRTAFFTVAQLLEDTGVRAYKGAVPSLNTGTTQDRLKDILEVALNIHSVEARHAARVRSLRRGGVQSTTAPKSWIAPAETPATPPLPHGGTRVLNAVGPYNAGSSTASPAESNVLQGQAALNVQTLITGVSGTAGAEAFDEPLDAATVKAIAKNFLAVPTAFFN